MKQTVKTSISTSSIRIYPRWVIVIAISKHQTLSPAIRYEGSSGGDGCTVWEKLFGSPGCKVTKISGSATAIKECQSARFLAYTVPAGTIKLTMFVPASGSCGRQYSTSCSASVTSFSLSGTVGAPVSPGCMRLLYNYKKTGNECSDWFLFRRCSTRCGWNSCPSSEFVLRIYDGFTKFSLVEMRGSSVISCEAHKVAQLFKG